jgi:hypothetical protein
MSLKRFLSGVGCLALAWAPATAADSVASSYVATQPGTMVVQAPAALPASPQTPVRPVPAPAPAPAPTPMTQAPMYSGFGESSPAGTEQAASAVPQMIGDSLAYVIANSSVVPPGGVARPVAGLAGSGFKIADNESVAPQDRLFLNTDYFTGVLSSLRRAPPMVPSTSLRLSREIFGFEKTFLDGDASFEARLPYFQLHDSGGGSVTDYGDTTLSLKYAFINNHCNDRDVVLSGGVALTVPTGPSTVAGTTNINPTIAQPFVGYFLGGDNLFVHGYSSLAIPFSDTISTVWFNDAGVGYYAWKGDGCIHAIVPTVEGHVTTPLGNIGANGVPVGILNTVVVTGGVSVIFAHHADLTFGYAFPITGPVPFESEYVVQFNWRF